MNALTARFLLDPAVTFLNHGSFGACPRAVLDVQTELRARLESEPVRFFVREYQDLLDAARRELAVFLGADPEGLAFVQNATAGVNAVLRSLDLAEGDELLVTDHAYNACRNALHFVAERSGARVVTVAIPFPGTTAAGVVLALAGGVTERTRLALVDHVTSPTGLVLPLERIVAELTARGVDVLVDGAHAPGMVPLALDRLGAAYYAGNCHKWLCAPKGAGFLQVRADRRDAVRPAIISHGASVPTTERPRFRHEFDWIGTVDPTPWLAIPAALRTVASLVPGGQDAVMAANRNLALEARDLLVEALGIERPCPDDLIGALAAVPLPDGPPGSPAALYIDPLQDLLWHRYRIEVPVSPWPRPPRRVLRISAQVYNERADYEALARALRALRG